MIINRLYKVSWLLLVGFLIIGYYAIRFTSNDYSSVSPAVAAPLIQNQYAECPPNSNSMWVEIDTYQFDGTPAQTWQIPFDSGEFMGSDGNIYVNYLLGVLLTEIPPVSDFDPDEKTMRAMAIMARTVAYKNCGCELLATNPNCSTLYSGHRGMDDREKQGYNPKQRNKFSLAERAKYQRAIDDTAGMYLTYNGAIFDAQYRAVSEEWTQYYGGGPHLGIYDPAGIHHQGEGEWPGFPQRNANHYARGENHGEQLPPYDAQRLLAHYLNAVNIVGLIPAPPNTYRFNILHFGGLDDRANNPLLLRTGETYPFSFSVQNSGNNDWSLYC